MIKYAKLTDEKTGTCQVGEGTNNEFYKSIGMVEMDVQQSDIDNKWYLTDVCPMKTDEQKAKEEQQRISILSLTAADVERGIYKAKGMDFEDIIAEVETLKQVQGDGFDIDVKALKIELKANNFYRGNPYVDAVGTLLGFSKTQLDKFFETNDYTKLLEKDS